MKQLVQRQRNAIVVQFHIQWKETKMKIHTEQPEENFVIIINACDEKYVLD